MRKSLVFVLLLLFVSFSLTSAGNLVKLKDPSVHAADDGLTTSATDYPAVMASGGHPPGIQESPGEIIGETFYDFQHNSSVGHQIAVNDDGTRIHVVWMHSDNEQHQPRRVKYRYRDADGIWGSINNVDGGPRAGYTCVDLHSDGSAVVGYHLEEAGIPQAQVAKDLIEGFGSFIGDYVDNNSIPTEEIIWPKVAIGPGDICHVISCNTVPTGGDNSNFYYSRSNSGDYQNGGFLNWDEIDNTYERARVFSHSIDASRTSQKVVQAFLLSPDAPEDVPYQQTNDVYFRSSIDGGTTWSELINLTNYNEVLPGDEINYIALFEGPYDFWIPENHPTLGDMDAFYIQADFNVEVHVDTEDVAHVVWTTMLYAARNDTLQTQCFIGNMYHWDDLSQQVTIVYDDVHGNDLWNDTDDVQDFFNRFDVFDASLHDLSIANDADNNLYVVFGKYFAGDYGALVEGFDSQMYNSEVMAIGSMDGGATWGTILGDGVAVNLTETSTPECQPGECDNDAYPTVAKKVTDDGDGTRTLHVLYMDDYSAGSSIRDNGPASNNPMRYLAVPVEEIIDIVIEIEEDSDNDVAANYEFLTQNRPNPFVKQTSICFNLANAGNVSLSIYNQVGQLLKTLENGYRPAGEHEINWDGTNENGEFVSAGVYFYRLSNAERVVTKRMVKLN